MNGKRRAADAVQKVADSGLPGPGARRVPGRTAEEPKLGRPGDSSASGGETQMRILTPHEGRFIICEEMGRDLLTDFELMILLAALRLGEQAYGVQIAREIETVSGRKVLLGAAYAALDRLERNGFVSSTIGASTPERGGRAKRFFEVTPRGLRAVKQTQQALIALWRDVPQLKERRT